MYNFANMRYIMNTIKTINAISRIFLNLDVVKYQ